MLLRKRSKRVDRAASCSLRIQLRRLHAIQDAAQESQSPAQPAAIRESSSCRKPQSPRAASQSAAHPPRDSESLRQAATPHRTSQTPAPPQPHSAHSSPHRRPAPPAAAATWRSPRCCQSLCFRSCRRTTPSFLQRPPRPRRAPHSAEHSDSPQHSTSTYRDCAPFGRISACDGRYPENPART